MNTALSLRLSVLTIIWLSRLGAATGSRGQREVGVEIRLSVTGSAERILVYTNQGNLTASTLEAGSAGEYRVRIPGPATAVQLDDCPPLNLR